mgnify:FL=1
MQQVNKDNKVIYVPSGDRRFNWRDRHDAIWYYKLSPALRNLYDFIIDKSDTGGVFNKSKLLEFNHRLYSDGINSVDKWFDSEQYLEALNKYRDIIRDLKDGYWFVEDYKCLLDNSTNVLDANIHKTGYSAGFIRSWEAHDIDPNSVRGIKEYIPKQSLYKDSTKTSNSNNDTTSSA